MIPGRKRVLPITLPSIHWADVLHIWPWRGQCFLYVAWVCTLDLPSTGIACSVASDSNNRTHPCMEIFPPSLCMVKDLHIRWRGAARSLHFLVDATWNWKEKRVDAGWNFYGQLLVEVLSSDASRVVVLKHFSTPLFTITIGCQRCYGQKWRHQEVGGVKFLTPPTQQY